MFPRATIVRSHLPESYACEVKYSRELCLRSNVPERYACEIKCGPRATLVRSNVPESYIYEVVFLTVRPPMPDSSKLMTRTTRDTPWSSRLEVVAWG
jgi:hypothetical protein